MKRLLRQDSLFFLLLAASLLGHLAIGHLGGEEIAAPELWQHERGKTTVSLQLAAVEQFPLEEELEPIESAPRIDLPMEMPPLPSPEMEPSVVPPEIEKTTDQQQAEMHETRLIERQSEFRLPPAVAIDLAATADRETEQQVELARSALRRETGSSLRQQQVKDVPVEPRTPRPKVASRSLEETSQPQRELDVIPRQSHARPPSQHTVKLPVNASRTALSQGSTGKEVPPSIRARRQPEYPRELISRGIEGRVMLRVDVSAAGRVLAIDIQTSSGHSRLDQAAMAAVSDWRFSPGRKDGRPAPMTVLLPVSFQLVR
jgi:TonB family protein